jgi:HEAT repeat protein
MPLIRKDSDPTPVSAPRSAENGLVALTQGSVEERWAAARAAVGLPGGAEALGRALATEPNARVREAILTSLARLRSFEGVQAVLPYLRSDNAGLRTEALDALRAMGETVKPHLPNLLGDPDPDVRILACDLARALPSSEATQLLCAVLATEAEANVCAAAVDVLAESGSPEALPALHQCAERFFKDPFLGFAIKVATGRIASQSGS